MNQYTLFFLFIIIVTAATLLFIKLIQLLSKTAKRTLQWAKDYIQGSWASQLFIVSFKGRYRDREVRCAYMSPNDLFDDFCYAAIKLRSRSKIKPSIDIPGISGYVYVRNNWLYYRSLAAEYERFFSKEFFPQIMEKLYNTARDLEVSPA